MLNLSPCTALKMDVPYRVWSGKDVSYDHLRVFVYKEFVHIAKDERSKLDAKTRQYIFIGYGQDQFDYRFYDHIKKRLVRSCDAIFIESETIKDIDKMEKDVPNSNGDSSVLELIPPTPVPREVGDEDQVNLIDEDDASIKFGSED